MEYLCKKAGLRIDDIGYNSSNSQFIFSLLYQKGIPYMEQSADVIGSQFSQEELNKFAELAGELNEKGYGDHAVFVIVK